MNDNDRSGAQAGTEGGLPAVLRAVVAGLAGAVAVTLLNEGVRRVMPHAPRMEVIGERALAAGLLAADVEPPHGGGLYRLTMAGDLISNGVYYALVGVGDPRGALKRGALLGVLGGLGGALLPRPLGLGPQPGEKPPITQVLTVLWYTAGGLVAAAVYGKLTERAEHRGQ